jgi:RNA polymerase sigma-70 factor, ECF subfamily
MVRRTNEDWLHALRQPGEEQTSALLELRDYLFRAVFVYLRDHRTELSDFTHSELREMAEDFAQEALLSVRDNLHKFRGDSKFTTWAYRFVINEALDELRRRHYRGKLSLDRLAEQESAVLKSLMEPGSGMDPELSAERQEFIRQLLFIIESTLNENQRLALLGVHFEGRSIQEVAAQLDTTPNTLYKMLHDARKKIRAELIARHLSGGDILALFEVWL